MTTTTLPTRTGSAYVYRNDAIVKLRGLTGNIAAQNILVELGFRCTTKCKGDRVFKRPMLEDDEARKALDAACNRIDGLLYIAKEGTERYRMRALPFTAEETEREKFVVRRTTIGVVA